MRRGFGLFLLLVSLAVAGAGVATVLDRQDDGEEAAPASTTTTAAPATTTSTTVPAATTTAPAPGGGIASGTSANESPGATAPSPPTPQASRPTTTATVPLPNHPITGGDSRLAQGLVLMALGSAAYLGLRARRRPPHGSAGHALP